MKYPKCSQYKGIVKLPKTRLTDLQHDGQMSYREPGMLGVGQLAFRQT